MQKLHNKGLKFKLIICIITAIMLCNFAVPNFAYAKTDPDDGGDLLKAIDQFVAYLGDKVMEWLQNSFTTEAPIENIDGTYNFQYSPAIIFSGDVPAFDINFIKPNNSPQEISDKQEWNEEKIIKYLDEIKNRAEENIYYFTEISKFNQEKEELDKLVGSKYKYFEDGPDFISVGKYNWTCYIYYNENELICYLYDTDEYGRTMWAKYIHGATGDYESTAQKLQSTIASWYKALRRIALVGLLSVLVYIGIRIVLSSSSPENQSKYKKMLTDWLVALCLLFTLHYIMSLTLTVTQSITKIFNTGPSDELLNNLRLKIRKGGSWGQVTGEVIMYVALIILTVKYTIQYLKRVIYMAFFTMIAPLICLTYPLDKIKDGQAQAFNMWIREYVFNALIQVVHLVIYYVLVSSALELVDNYTLYAIVALLFIKKAEDIVKKMFGFDKAETVNAIGAATTGALVMNAVNSLKRPPKQKGGSTSAGEGGSPKGVRTTKGDPLAGLRTAGAGTQGGGGTPGQQQQTQGAGQGGQNGGGGTPTQQPQVQPQNQGIPANLNQSNKPKIKPFSGVGSLAKKYTGPALSKIAGIGLGGAGALIGFSAGVAQGDIGKALTGATAGGAAGYHGGQKLGNAGANMITGATFGNLKNKWNNVKDTFNEGARGKEYVQNVRFDREFYKSEGYKKLMEDHEGTPKETIQDMLDVGITDPKDMDKILTNSTGGNLAEEIGYYTLAKDCDNGVFYDDEKLGKYLEGKLGARPGNINEVYDKMKKYK